MHNIVGSCAKVSCLLETLKTNSELRVLETLKANSELRVLETLKTNSELQGVWGGWDLELDELVL